MDQESLLTEQFIDLLRASGRPDLANKITGNPTVFYMEFLAAEAGIKLHLSIKKPEPYDVAIPPPY